MPLFCPGKNASALWQSSGSLNRTKDYGGYTFSLFCEWHCNGIGSYGPRLTGPLRVFTVPDDYAMLRTNAQTMN